MSLQLDIICDNTVGRPVTAYGEHGFSCLISTPEGRWLFDTGSGDTLLHNLAVLGHSPTNLNGVILSHGHYDHCGGLKPLLQRTGKQKIYAHSRIFKKRYWQGLHEQRNISMPYSQRELENAGAQFIFLDSLTKITSDIYYSGPIPRKSLSEPGDPHLVQQENDDRALSPDQFEDDAALAIRTGKGLVIILGCAHSGLINTVDFFCNELQETKVHAIVGGTHLGPASDEQFEATLEYLSRLNPDRVGLSHCTGQIRSAQLYAKFPNKVFFANVGTTVKV